MTEIQFLASSKPFSIPREMEESNGFFFERGVSFFVNDLEPYWIEIMQPFFTMPYLYEATGLGSKNFWRYIEHFMEVGDVIELYHIPVQNWYQDSIRKMMDNPQHISINIGSRTYENGYGSFKLKEKNWVEELAHRTLVTEFGVTTILRY
ncbi:MULTISPECIES: hypothetical protein [unclassified Mesobacillus]|uniref:hypothetical protein n=1 Tax=unclassified Mesobacillus TaxID=2675270 RepID=UPI00203F9EEB|nr:MULTISPECIES: hypothetical protein [unclassified Mesobacillus]MCM3124413.1 hypothetical protein [Mesobacillus sp. MER 33]MCM3234877.1 hypothetical protein [Mesobacillus sp. MER 48]